MARARRPRRPARSQASFDRFVSGFHHPETRHGAEWVVQPVSVQRARKEYTCPGCHRAVRVGVAHVVVWRADGILGDEADLEARRHWHTACWRMF